VDVTRWELDGHTPRGHLRLPDEHDAATKEDDMPPDIDLTTMDLDDERDEDDALVQQPTARRRPVTADEFLALDEDERNWDWFQRLPGLEQTRAQDLGVRLEDLRLHPPAAEPDRPSATPASSAEGDREDEDEPPAPPASSIVDGLAEAAQALAGQLSEGELASLEQTMRSKAKGLLTTVSEGFPAEVVQTVTDLLAAVEGFPDAHEQLQQLAVIERRVGEVKTTEFHAGISAPNTRTYFDGKLGRYVTVKVDDLGNQRDPVVGMSREEALAAIKAEEQERADEFGADPFKLGLEQFATWDHAKRRRFAERHPREFGELIEAASRAEL
jgi:hypothetical protein